MKLAEEYPSWTVWFTVILVAIIIVAAVAVAYWFGVSLRGP